MPPRTHTRPSTTRRAGLVLQKKMSIDSARADGIRRKWEEVSDEEIAKLAMKAGLIDRLDLTRFDWLPALREFASLLQSAERERCAEENKKLRHLLFMAHGSKEHYLYGDDGERTCNTCWIDFNTDSPDVIEQKIYAYNMRKIAKLQAEGRWPPEFLKPANAKLTGDTLTGEKK